MKSLLAGATFAIGLAAAGSAMAADLPRRVAPPVFTPIPVFTWTGFYAGINAGYGIGTDDFDSSRTIVRVPAAVGLLQDAAGNPTGGRVRFFNQANNGFVGGGQIGYNFQFTPGTGVVVGIEADAQYADFGGYYNRFDTSLAARPSAGTRFFNPNGSNVDFFGTVRGRLGYAFDRVLFYGTGGFAYGMGENPGGAANTGIDDFKTGWTAGGGIEYALPTDSFLNFFRSSAVTFKTEALYVNLDNPNNRIFAVRGSDGRPFTIGGAAGNALESGPLRRSNEFVVVRGGLNYKFGSY